jgi:hypothetical protein
VRGTTKKDQTLGQKIPAHRPGAGGKRNTVKQNEERVQALEIQARMLAIILRADEDQSRYNGTGTSQNYGHRLKAYASLRAKAKRLREGAEA